MANELLNAASAASAARAVKTWLNTYQSLPDGVSVTFEDLPENDFGICFSTDQAAVYAVKYITGGFRAEYRFRIIVRVLPTDDGDMLDAVEFLTGLCAWCETATPPSISGASNAQVRRTSDVAVLGVYEDGCSDYGASMTLTWEEF